MDSIYQSRLKERRGITRIDTHTHTNRITANNGNSIHKEKMTSGSMQVVGSHNNLKGGENVAREKGRRHFR